MEKRKKEKNASKLSQWNILSMAEHLGSISVTGQRKYQKDFTPFLPGIKYSPYNDFEALEKFISDKTCAVID